MDWFSRCLGVTRSIKNDGLDSTNPRLESLRGWLWGQAEERSPVESVTTLEYS